MSSKISVGDRLPVFANPLRGEGLIGYGIVVRLWGQLSQWYDGGGPVGRYVTVSMLMEGESQPTNHVQVEGDPPPRRSPSPNPRRQVSELDTVEATVALLMVPRPSR